MNPCPFCGKLSCDGLCAFDAELNSLDWKPPLKRTMTPAQYADFMAKHAPAGKRTNKRKEFFSGDK